LPLRSQKLQLVVREPYTPAGTRYRLTCFTALPGEVIGAESMMQEASLFLDGPYREIRLSLGDVARFSASDEPLHVLGLGEDGVGRARRALRRHGIGGPK
jgi:NAD+ kinase